MNQPSISTSISASISAPVRLALVGAGVFVQKAHLPALLALASLFEIVAIFSPSGRSAQELADLLSNSPWVTTDLAALLVRPDVDAVDVVLPIGAMPDVVAAALAGGKHLISEKPIAPDLVGAGRLLDAYAASQTRFPGQVWMVGENWRYEPAFIQAAELVRDGAIGRPITFHWAHAQAMSPGNPYYGTPWRRDGSVPGGFVLDAGVHHMAALGMILGEVAQVQAQTASARPDLPPVDTVSATLTMRSGAIGTYAATYALPSSHTPPGDAPLVIIGDEGRLHVQRSLIEIKKEGEVERFPIKGYRGVELELAAFAAAVQRGTAHRNPPQAAAQDLAVIEAMLRSAREGRRVVVEIGRLGDWAIGRLGDCHDTIS